MVALYGAARIYWTVFSEALPPQETLRNLLLGFGAATAILGALMCFGQRNLKRLLAFSTISHVGIVAIGLALLSPQALAGAAIYVLGQGATKAALFLAAGVILHRLGEVDEFELHGRGREIPLAGIVLAIGAAGLSGVPPSGIFLGSALMQRAAADLHKPWAEAIAMISAILTSAAVFRFSGRVFLGWGPKHPKPFSGEPPPTSEKPETEGGHRHTPAAMYAPACALVALGILIGATPRLALRAEQCASRFENRIEYRSIVFNASPSEHAEPEPLTEQTTDSMDLLEGFAALDGGILIALLVLLSSAVRKAIMRLGRIMAPLRGLHNGHVGDYTAWLTFGVALFGGILAFALR